MTKLPPEEDWEIVHHWRSSGRYYSAADEQRDGVMRLFKQKEFGPCPLGDDHDMSGDMVFRAGYSCIKCHKTWDRHWRPTYD